jgi:hypothetical protein
MITTRTGPKVQASLRATLGLFVVDGSFGQVHRTFRRAMPEMKVGRAGA